MILAVFFLKHKHIVLVKKMDVKIYKEKYGDVT